MRRPKIKKFILKKITKNMSNDSKLFTETVFASPAAVAGSVIIIIFLIMSVVGLFNYPYDPFKMDLKNLYAFPSPDHLFGTDELGRDIFSRVLAGAPISLQVILLVTAIALSIGTVLGLIAGWYGGYIDELIMRVTDIFLAIPPFILALGLSAGLGASITSVMIAISITQWPIFARIIRSEALTIREKPYVEAARASGVSNYKIMTRHILPNSLAPLVVTATLNMGSVLMTAAGLSFLGFGAQVPSPEWGRMIATAYEYIRSAPTYPLLPGVVITIVVLGFNLLGDGLRDALDPRIRRTQQSDSE